MNNKHELITELQECIHTASNLNEADEITSVVIQFKNGEFESDFQVNKFLEVERVKK